MTELAAPHELHAAQPTVDACTAAELANAAMQSHNWAEAIRLWDIAQALNPNIDPTRNKRGVALLHLEEDAALGVPTPVNIERVQNPEARELVLKFESLGENCEFGLVQRRFEAEPLGFLRWTAIPPGTLIRLLESGFEGIGDIGTLMLRRATWGEYYLKDKATGVIFHTYLNDCGPDESLFLKKQSARLIWLKNKLIEDLGSGGKVFIYKVHSECTDEGMSRIASLIRGYGDNGLLCVRCAPAGVTPGSIRSSSDDGMITGYLSRICPTPDNVWHICYDEWLSICRLTAAVTKSPHRQH
jgi:hypothetical protein